MDPVANIGNRMDRMTMDDRSLDTNERQSIDEAVDQHDDDDDVGEGDMGNPAVPVRTPYSSEKRS
jgi:hypothetical protein